MRIVAPWCEAVGVRKRRDSGQACAFDAVVRCFLVGQLRVRVQDILVFDAARFVSQEYCCVALVVFSALKLT